MLRGPSQTFAAVLFFLAAGAALAQENPWTALRPLGADALVVFVRVQKATGDGLRAVPIDHRFSPGDRFAFEVSPSRGGYVALHALGPERQLGERIWPPAPGGEPVAARAFTRLPPGNSLSLKGKGPTRLALVFSLTPLGSQGGEIPAARWLKQIRVRDVVVNADSLPEAPAAVFQGKAAAGQPVGLQVVLALGG